MLKIPKIEYNFLFTFFFLKLCVIKLALSQTTQHDFNVDEQWRNKGGPLQQGMYSSPVFAQDSQGRNLIVGAAQSVYAIELETGSQIWNNPNPMSGSTLADVVVVTDNFHTSDPKVYFITGHDNGWVCAYDEDGNEDWCMNVATEPIHSLVVGQIRKGLADFSWYIVVGISSVTESNTIIVLNDVGNIVFRSPRPSSIDGSCPSESVGNVVTLSDLSGDGNLEIIAPCSNCNIHIYDQSGEPFPADDYYYTNDNNVNGFWNLVCQNRMSYPEKTGEINSGVGELENIGTLFSHSPSVTFIEYDDRVVIASSVRFYEIVVSSGTQFTRGKGIFLRFSDAQRYANTPSGYDWILPVETSVRIDDDDGFISPVLSEIAPVDIDGDSFVELIMPSDDGYLHCYWLNKEEKYNWPFQVTTDFVSDLRFASGVVVFNVPTYGAVIVFVSYPAKESSSVGYLHFLNALGDEIEKVELPLSTASPPENGGLSTPTLFRPSNVSNLFVTIQSIRTGNVLYELKGTQTSKILWQSGRGDFLRSGAAKVQNDGVTILPPWTPPDSPTLTWDQILLIAGLVSGAVVGIVGCVVVCSCIGCLIFWVFGFGVLDLLIFSKRKKKDLKVEIELRK